MPTFCGQCGSSLENQFKFCWQCGSPVAPTVDSEHPSPELGQIAALVEHNPPWNFLAIPILVLLVSFLGTVWIYRGQLPVPQIRYVAWLLSFVPPVIFIPLVLWLDRHESEPPWLLAIVFLWGAFGATLLSFVINSAVGVIFGEVVAAVASAPVVEELAKGLALFFLFHYKRDEFNGVLDGLVYATMVALGFAMTENVLYFGRAAMGVLEVPLGSVFWVRGVLSPLSHPIFTSLTGIGLGLAVQSYNPVVRTVSSGAGLLAAMFFHHIWNQSGLTGSLPQVYVEFFAPGLLVLVVIAVSAMRRERKVLAEQLASEVESGVITEQEYSELTESRLRRRRLFQAFLRGGIGDWARVFRFYELLMDLAFKKWRHAIGCENRSPLELQVYRAAVRVARAKIPPGL